MEIRNYLEPKYNKNATFQNLWDQVTVMVNGNILALKWVCQERIKAENE